MDSSKAQIGDLFILKSLLNGKRGEELCLYQKNNDIKPSPAKIWLVSPTVHGPELEYVKEAYETNWMYTVGKSVNEVEKIAAKKADVKYAVGLSSCIAALHLYVKLV